MGHDKHVNALKALGSYIPESQKPLCQRKGRLVISTAAGLVADVEEPARRGDGTSSTGSIAYAIVQVPVHWEPTAQPKAILGAPGGSHVQDLALVLQASSSGVVMQGKGWLPVMRNDKRQCSIPRAGQCNAGWGLVGQGSMAWRRAASAKLAWL